MELKNFDPVLQRMTKERKPGHRLSLSEIFLLELAIWLAVWLLNDYMAALLTVIVSAIVLAVLVIALLAEAIERSKVPRWYFWVMGLSILASLGAALLYAVLFSGRFEFIE
ncbi:MAG: hypothetical protein JNJ90_15535 [Saprospiraceae bacterium]|nr:hypothetical protein [Saprospiraceae bacterium]